MDKNTVDWHGPWVALVTPFDAEGRIDEAAYRRNVELCIGYGCTGLLANGCTGEFWAQSMDERKAVMRLCADAAGGRATVIGGAGAITPSEVIELVDAAKDAGCDGAMVLPSYFVHPSPDDIITFYETVSDATDLPLLLYNIPSAANRLTPGMVDRLADVKNVVAIKESSRDFNNFYETLALAGDRIRVLIGPGGLFGVAALTVGAVGYVEGIQNYWGKDGNDIYYATMDGDMERALKLQKQGLLLRQLIDGGGRNIYAAFKAAMNVRGLPGGYPRPPLQPLGEPHLSELRQGFREFGLSVAERAAAE
jgi:dihydrodipicolinate synthase/N-acetylneuraminate lyase